MNKLLTQGFSTFLRRRRAKAHFERRPLLDTLTASSAAAPRAGSTATAALGQELLAAAKVERTQALAAELKLKDAYRKVDESLRPLGKSGGGCGNEQRAGAEDARLNNEFAKRFGKIKPTCTA